MLARENPLITENLESLKYQFLNGNWEELLRKLDSLNYRGALVGPQGSGKTTLFLEIKKHFEAKGDQVYLYGFKKDAKKIPLNFWFKQFPNNSILMVDGAEQLNILEWNLLKLKSKSMKGLLVTSHEPGLLPTIIDCNTTESLFLNLLSQLTDSKLAKDLASSAYKNNQGNIRLAFLEIYDALSNQK